MSLERYFQDDTYVLAPGDAAAALVAEVATPATDEWARVYLRNGEEGSAVAFQAFGSPALIASMSRLCELLSGAKNGIVYKTLPDQVLASFTLPPEKRYLRLMIEDLVERLSKSVSNAADGSRRR